MIPYQLVLNETTTSPIEIRAKITMIYLYGDFANAPIDGELVFEIELQ